MKNILSYFFNWKKNPASVFYFAIPLFLVGMGSMGLLAYLHWQLKGDWVYGAIFFTGLLVLAIALVPVFRIHQINQKMTAKLDRSNLTHTHTRSN